MRKPPAGVIVRFAVAFASLLTFTRCMWSPHNQQIFTRSSSIPFQGCSLFAGSTLQIQACPRPEVYGDVWCKQGFVTLSTLQAPGTSNYTDSTGANWYCWSANVSIPASYWHVPGAAPTASAPASTVVRLVDNSQPVYYYITDHSFCPYPYGMAQTNTNNSGCAQSPVPLSTNLGLAIFADSFD